MLPFDNMSNDPDQEYFVDGITEDLITALSLIPDLKLIAAELAARYVLEGSVRKAGNRVRITAQLVDAVAGAHVWADPIF